MRKKLLCMITAVGLMAVSMLAGCGSSNSERNTQQKEAEESISAAEKSDDVQTGDDSKEIVFPLEETMEFTCFSAMSLQYELSDSLAWQEALKRANISVDMTSVALTETTEKANLLIASDDYPDMFYKGGNIDYESETVKEILIPLEDLIREYAPNLCALMDERNAWSDIMDAEGHIYTMPMIHVPTLLSGGPMWINQKWLDNLGLEIPTDMESLYQVLKAFKEKDADGDGDPNNEIPYLGWDGNIINLLLYDDDITAYKTYHAIVTEENSLEFFANQEGYKEFLEYCTKMYAEGILDNNCFTQTRDETIAKTKANNNVGMFIDYASNGMVADEYALDYVAVYPFNEAGGVCDTGIYTGGMAITDKCENPEVLVAWADYFYCEEGARLADMGIEGVTYEINEDGSFSYIFDLGECFGKPKDVIQGGTSAAMKFADLRWKVNPETDPINAHVYSQRLAVYDAGTIVPTLKLTDEEKNRSTDRWAEINNYISNYTAEVVSGIISLEDTWDDYVSTLDDMGVDEVFSVYQAAWERANK